MECVCIHLIEKGINYYIMIVYTMYRTFNSQVIVFTRYMDEELYTLCVSEYNRHEYTIYVTFIVISNNLIPLSQNLLNYIALNLLYRARCQTLTQENELRRGPVYITLISYRQNI